MITDRFFEDGDNYELRMMAGLRDWDSVKHLINTLDGTGMTPFDLEVAARRRRMGIIMIRTSLDLV
jgi:hypothetical protein